MARYINADVLEKNLDSQLETIQMRIMSDDVKLISALLVHGIHLDIENTPTSDVVEVVRCKDCVHWKTELESTGIECEPGENAHICWMDGMITRTNDYCSYGRRK